MRFSVSPALIEQLRRVHQERGWRDEVITSHDSFLLDPGLGPAYYLTADGRVLVDGSGWDGTPLREADDDEATAAVVVGAKKTGVRELLALLPERPSGAANCEKCGGARWMSLGQDVSGQPVSVICVECRGRGWRS